MTPRDFEKIVCESLKSLPKFFRDKLQNMDVVIEEGTADQDILGLYEGTPLSERGQGYSGVLPDKITLYRRAIEAECKESGKDIREEIRHTVRHEIAHHLGISDERMDDLDVY